MNNAQLFVEERKLISDDALRALVTYVIWELPDYFREIGASTSGKHHPKFALGPGGLIRHTKAAVGIATELMRGDIYGKVTDEERDIVYSALILHDGLKCGLWEDHTAFDHPLLMAAKIKTIANLFDYSDRRKLRLLCRAVASHMGKWNTHPDWKIKLPKPKTRIQKIVHLADYIASRKCLEYQFEGEVN